jgi:phage terminase large subunit-like protein
LGAFKHTKGRWAGVPLRLGEGLDPWQVVWVLAPIFGWVYQDGEIGRVVRVVRSAWVEVPRKAGKSTLASGISGVLLLADQEAGAEVYNVAGSTLQAGRVFEDAKRMLLTSPFARKRVEPLKEVVRVPASGGVLRVLSRVAETAHGLNVSGGIVDEVHTLRLRRALVEAIETGTGARDQPLVVFITTADEAEEGDVLPDVLPVVAEPAQAGADPVVGRGEVGCVRGAGGPVGVAGPAGVGWPGPVGGVGLHGVDGVGGACPPGCGAGVVGPVLGSG